jgi:hypothetical protein
MTQRVYRQIERVIIGAMILGIIAMFQPIRIELYSLGFHLLLASTIIFTVFSHFQPKSQE